tara:strand:+ start:223 stop:477 length:255 start_codon:yes stop_codon:yes gene_type:complete
MSVSYTITVSESVKNSIVKACEKLTEEALIGAEHGCSLYNEENFDKWVEGNKSELSRLQRANLFANELGYNHRWKRVDEEDSAE